MDKKLELKNQLQLSVPSAFECIIGTLISMVDLFAISFFGSKSIAAVGAMLSFINFLNLIIKSIQVSNNSIIARDIGSKNLSNAAIITGNSVIIATVFQLICILITLIISPCFPKLFKVDSICLTYLYIRLIGSIPSAISTIVSGHERTFGKSKQMLYISVFSLILNIILNYTFIKLGYGLKGIAWATVIIELTNMIIVLITSRHTINFKPKKNVISKILKFAKHGVLDRIFDRGGKLVLDIILSRLGTFEYAAHIMINQIESFANDFCYGFGIGITTNMGIKLGSNDKKEIEMIRSIINKIINVLCIIVSIIILISSLLLLPILLREKETLTIAYKILPLTVIYSILMPIRYKWSSFIEALQEFKFNAQVSLFVNVVKIILGFILSKILGVIGIWFTFIIIYIVIILTLKKKVRKLFI